MTTSWPGSTWERVCAECFSGDEEKMLEHAVAYLKADPSNVPAELHLGNKFREIIASRNRRQWWTTARVVLLARREARKTEPREQHAEVGDSPPMVLGRRDDGTEDPRAMARLIARASQAFCQDSEGILAADLYMSEDREDRGGFVLRLRMGDATGAFLPAVRLLPDGIEVHMAGDVEGEALLNVLQVLTQFCRPAPWRTDGMGVTTFERMRMPTAPR